MELSNFYVSSKLKPFGLERLFEKVFSRMLTEMKLLSSAFYSYENGEAKKDVFALIERTWVGIFSQSIAKAYPELPLIQEFSVWDTSKKCIGRCDLLLRWEDQNKNYDIIFEAKQC